MKPTTETDLARYIARFSEIKKTDMGWVVELAGRYFPDRAISVEQAILDLGREGTFDNMCVYLFRLQCKRYGIQDENIKSEALEELKARVEESVQKQE